MGEEDRNGRSELGCLIILLVLTLVVLLVPSVLLLMYATPHAELAAGPEVTSVRQAVRMVGRDLAWVQAHADWRGDPPAPSVVVSTHGLPWAAAEGEVIAPRTPGGPPVLQWRLRVGLLGFTERYCGTTPLPTPADAPPPPAEEPDQAPLE
ncbi:MAG: hypothetical protein GXY85_10365 [Candidatus Brocadiaceae bacterium]|nr:hypothetical protein [Candidatus Brocadiaceae bacterium]